MTERAAIEAKISATEAKLASAENDRNEALIVAYSNILTEQQKEKNIILLAGSGNLNPMSLFFMSIVYACQAL
jgi:hypothetical protein